MRKNQRYWCQKERVTKTMVKDVNGVLLQQVYSFKHLGSELMTEGGVNFSSETKSTDSLEQIERNNRSDL